MSTEDNQFQFSDYPETEVRRENMPDNPFTLFSRWFDETLDAGLPEPNGMVIATMGDAGMPSQRTVLLKSFDEGGLYFYTNYHSRKARELAANPRVSCLFPWLALHRQVEIQGTVLKVDRDNSAQYFATRPRGSQVGAWASRQSEPLPDRSALEEQVRVMEKRFVGGEVPLPEFWGGYCVRADRVEFWQGRASRLHDRFVYTRDLSNEAQWDIERLYP